MNIETEIRRVVEEAAEGMMDSCMDVVHEHLGKQPREAGCYNCGGDLKVNARVDEDGDLILEIYPCETCQKTAISDALDSA